MLVATLLNPESLESVFTGAAIIGGVVLLLQVGMIMLGMDDGGLGDMADGIDLGLDDVGGGDSGGDGGGDFDASNTTDSWGLWLLEMISIRTLSAAATFFGLVGMASLSGGQTPTVSLGLASAAGFGALYAVYWAFKQIFKLEVDGNEDIRNAVGIVGKVYVPIDPGMKGKIQLKMQGRTVEYQAISDHAERLATGATVLITDIISSDTVKVASREV